MPSTANILPGNEKPAAASGFAEGIFRYGLALGSVAGATALGFFADWLNLHQSVFTFFLLAVALTSWYAGVGPAIIAFAAGELAFDYFFTPPMYTLAITREDVAYFPVFTLFSGLLIWFGVVRRRSEVELRKSRDELEIKVAERTEHLRASEQKYRELIDASPDAILVWDKNGNCVLGNAAAAALRGCSETELGALTMAETYIPEERHRIRERFDWVAHQGILRFERRFLRKDNEIVPVEVSLSTAGEDHYQAVVRDISERQRAERELRKQADLLRLAHDAIIVRDADGRITFWNAGAEKTYGWTGQEVMGKTTHELLKTRFPVSGEAIDVALENEGVWEGELTHRTRHGKTIIVASRQSLRRDEQGNPTAILEINRDVSDRKRAEEVIRKLNEDLEQRVIERTAELAAVNKELEAFAYSVSHDLRAPVRHIAGFTALLQKHADAVLDGKSRHHINMILDSAHRMGNLVDDLLSFSRIGRAETQQTTVHLERLVEAAVAEVAPDIQGRKIVWRIGALPICYGDPAMLRIVFSNLVSNAVKFTRTRSQAEIQIDSLNHNPDEVVVFVRDNGIGFDMKYRNKLFGVFQRLHSQEAFEGTGIGLATVQRIVHRHGGTVWVESSVDQGATFYVALPKPGKIRA